MIFSLPVGYAVCTMPVFMRTVSSCQQTESQGGKTNKPIFMVGFYDTYGLADGTMKYKKTDPP